jgi:thiol-disulfide isomerase/thioredoxin
MRPEKLALSGTIAAVVGAGLCCVGPVLFNISGFGAFSAAPEFASLRPYLLAVAVLAEAGLNQESFAANSSNAQERSSQPAPDFKLPDLDGRQISSVDLKGSVIVLDFWATWCGPCLAEIPTLNALHAKYAARGVKMIGIAAQSGWAEDIKPYRDKYKVAYPTLIGDDEVVEKYGVLGFPTTYILNKDFKVHRKFTGKLPERKELEREIESLLAAH